jgi:hypothetical protein
METKKKIKKKSDNKFEKEIIPSEKWLVSFKNNNNRGILKPMILYEPPQKN